MMLGFPAILRKRDASWKKRRVYPDEFSRTDGESPPPEKIYQRAMRLKYSLALLPKRAEECL